MPDGTGTTNDTRNPDSNNWGWWWVIVIVAIIFICWAVWGGYSRNGHYYNNDAVNSSVAPATPPAGNANPAPANQR